MLQIEHEITTLRFFRTFCAWTFKLAILLPGIFLLNFSSAPIWQNMLACPVSPRALFILEKFFLAHVLHELGQS